ncbi:MAG: enoyl-CoA hydratase/isomerase family protein [Myxococcota bacterium]
MTALLDWTALRDELATPGCTESYSPLKGAAFLAVDLLRFPAEAPDAEVTAVVGALASLPCPTIGVGAGEEFGATRRVADALDVVVADHAALAILATAIEASPLAAQSLVQLLRTSGALAVHAGLWAESWVYSTLQSGDEFRRWLAARPERSLPGPGASVRVERDRGRLEIWLARPERRNAFSRGMRDELCEALQLAVMDETLGSVCLRGEGRAFCSGGDLAEFGTTPDPATAHAIRATRHPGRLLHQLHGRLEVTVHGACVGAGVELPAFAGRVVARRDATFRLPELSMGLVPGAGGTVSLPRRIGRQRTAWLALSGVALDAATALSWGLVDAIVD